MVGQHDIQTSDRMTISFLIPVILKPAKKPARVFEKAYLTTIVENAGNFTTPYIDYYP